LRFRKFFGAGRKTISYHHLTTSPPHLSHNNSGSVTRGRALGTDARFKKDGLQGPVPPLAVLFFTRYPTQQNKEHEHGSIEKEFRKEYFHPMALTKTTLKSARFGRGPKSDFLSPFLPDT